MRTITQLPGALLQARGVPEIHTRVPSLDSLFSGDALPACKLSMYFTIIRNHCCFNTLGLAGMSFTESSKSSKFTLF